MLLWRTLSYGTKLYPLSEILLHNSVRICHTLLDASGREIVKQIHAKGYKCCTSVQEAAEHFLNIMIATCVSGLEVAADL